MCVVNFDHPAAEQAKITRVDDHKIMRRVWIHLDGGLVVGLRQTSGKLDDDKIEKLNDLEFDFTVKALSTRSINAATAAPKKAHSAKNVTESDKSNKGNKAPSSPTKAFSFKNGNSYTEMIKQKSAGKELASQ